MKHGMVRPRQNLGLIALVATRTGPNRRNLGRIGRSGGAGGSGSGGALEAVRQPVQGIQVDRRRGGAVAAPVHHPTLDGLSEPVLAHVGTSHGLTLARWWAHWELRPELLVPVLGVGLLYGLGWWRLRRRSGADEVSFWRLTA